MSELPAFAIIYGPRAFISLAGVATIILGTWKAENTFDELGVKAFESANAAGLEPVAYFDDVSNINKDGLDSACPIPWLILVGFGILALSNFIPQQLPMGWPKIEITLPALIGFVCCLTIAFLMAWPIREAYSKRDMKSMVQNYQFIAAFALVLVGAVIADNKKGPSLLCPIGRKYKVMT